MAVIIYWSGTGNTESIANRIANDKGIVAKTVSDASVDDVKTNDVVLFGCPAMGAEELEEEEFRPFFESVKPDLNGKNVLLFGSYGWGDGEWLESFKAECEDSGANVLATIAAMGDESALDDNEYQSYISQF